MEPQRGSLSCIAIKAGIELGSGQGEQKEQRTHRNSGEDGFAADAAQPVEIPGSVGIAGQGLDAVGHPDEQDPVRPHSGGDKGVGVHRQLAARVHAGHIMV